VTLSLISEASQTRLIKGKIHEMKKISSFSYLPLDDWTIGIKFAPSNRAGV
jgi:hypothetical protein